MNAKLLVVIGVFLALAAAKPAFAGCEDIVFAPLSWKIWGEAKRKVGGFLEMGFPHLPPSAFKGSHTPIFPPSNVRFAPSTNAGVKDVIRYRTSVGVIGKSGEWYKINYPIPGWIHESQISKECLDNHEYYPDESEYESNYDRFIRIGDDLYERGDFQSALINYRRALRERPGDSYALKAIRIVQKSIGERGF